MSVNVDAVQRLYVAYFNRPGDPAGMQHWQSRLPSTAATQAQLESIANNFSGSAEYTSLYAGLSNTAVVNQLYNNLFGRSAETTGLLHWAGQLDNGTITFARLALQLTYSAQGTDAAVIANKLAASRAFTDALDTTAEIVGYSGTAAAASARAWLATVSDTASSLTTATAGVATAVTNATAASASSASPGATYTLTTGRDSPSNTSGNDIYNATNATITSAGQTFNSEDTVDGGSGIDTLNIDHGVASVTYQLINVRNVEVVNANFTAAGVLSLLGSSGITTLTSKGSTAAANFANIESTNIGLGVISSAKDANFVYTAAATAGSADSVTLTVNGVTTGGTITIDGIETLNIISTGTANSIGNLAASAATTINISGEQSINLGTALTVARSLSGITHGLSGANGITATLTNTNSVTVLGGAGNDVISITDAGGADNSVLGGDGNDVITFSQNLTNSDTVSGGNGIADTLVADSSSFVNFLNLAGRITGFERITVSNALQNTLTTANIQTGIERVNLQSIVTQAVVFENGAKTISFSGASAAGSQTLTVSDTGNAITDSLIILNSSAAADSFSGADALTILGFEVVTIDTSTTTTRQLQTAGAIGVTPDSGGSVALNFIGNNSITTAALTATSATSGTVDGSGLTGTAALTLGAATIGITSIIGSSNADTLVGSATATTIDGGAGNDNITGGVANDVITGSTGDDTIDGAALNDSLLGGDGNDSITAGTGNDTVIGGSGNDRIIFGGNLATGDSIDGGDGTADVLIVSQASLTTIGAYAISVVTTLNDRISNVERIEITDTLQNNAAFDIARLDSINYISLIAGYNGAGAGGDANEELSGLASGSTVVLNTGANHVDDVLALTLADNSGASNSLNLIMTESATTDYGNLAVSGIETVNLFSNEIAENTAIRVATLGISINRSDGVNTRAVTLNISGTESLTLDTVVGADLINAAGLSGAARFLMTNTAGSLLGQTITGGSGADLIHAGDGADTIDGGAGDDYLKADSSAEDDVDTVTGGSGNDTIVFSDAGEADVFHETSAVGSSDTLLINGQIDISTINMNGAGAGTALNGASGLGFENILVSGASATLIGAQLTGLTINFSEHTAATTTVIVTATAGAATNLSGVTFNAHAYVGSAGTAVTSNAFTDGTDYFIINGLDGSNETITGTSFADSISGGTGADVLSGGSGSDTIIGGAGADNLSGGAGADRFTYATVAQGGAAATVAANSALAAGDTISDFTSTSDKLAFLGVSQVGTAATAAAGTAGTWSMNTAGIFIVTGSSLNVTPGTTTSGAVATAIGALTGDANDVGYVAIANAAGTSYTLFQLTLKNARAAAAADTTDEISIVGTITSAALVAGDIAFV